MATALGRAMMCAMPRWLALLCLCAPTAAAAAEPFGCAELVEVAGRALSTDEVLTQIQRRGVAGAELACVMAAPLPASIRTAASRHVSGKVPADSGLPAGVLRARLAGGDWALLTPDGRWTLEPPPPSAPPSSVRTDGFRGLTWGSTSAQVRRKERASLDRVMKNALVYDAAVAGLQAEASYLFADAQLVAGRYLFTAEHVDDLDYIRDYEHVLGLLADRYGRPVVDEDTWSNDTYRDQPNAWGFAVALGYLTRVAEWELADARVVLRLSGDGDDIFLRLDYQSRAWLDRRAAQQKTKDMRGL